MWKPKSEPDSSPKPLPFLLTTDSVDKDAVVCLSRCGVGEISLNFMQHHLLSEIKFGTLDLRLCVGKHVIMPTHESYILLAIVSQLSRK